MNRFLISYTPEWIARELCDKHIVKMPLEEAQMLSTAVWEHAPEYAEKHDLYKPVHQKHPCTIWAAKTRANYNYGLALFDYMQAEYRYRYGKVGAWNRHYFALQDAAQYIPEGDITPHPECFSEHTDLKTGENWPIKSYRKFYMTKQRRFSMKWTNRPVPSWFHFEEEYA